VPEPAGVASKWGGGGHRNAAGATLTGPIEALKSAVVAELGHAMDEAIERAQSR
jgi:nanoRNase/pAp phosphatase (c-di-AMP/oligoRNAs hydrolase)